MAANLQVASKNAKMHIYSILVPIMFRTKYTVSVCRKLDAFSGGAAFSRVLNDRPSDGVGQLIGLKDYAMIVLASMEWPLKWRVRSGRNSHLIRQLSPRAELAAESNAAQSNWSLFAMAHIRRGVSDRRFICDDIQ